MEFSSTEIAVSERLGIPVDTIRLVLDTLDEEYERIETEQFDYWKTTGERLYEDGPVFTGMFISEKDGKD